MTNSIAVEVKGLSYSYNGQLAVCGLSFEVKTGHILGLLGPNGAGKSTTLKMLTTLLPPTGGTAYVKGYSICREAKRVRQNIGYVPQSISADGDLTGYENLLISAKLYGLNSATRKKKIAELLEFMGLSEASHQLVNQYSGGMIRRLEIAQALVHQPAVLFLDEPTIGLDPSARRMIWQRIEFLRKHFDTTVVLTTHDMNEADFLCDQVAFMHLGNILKLDQPRKLKEELGPNATLEDVFVHYAGTSIEESGGDYNQAKQIRKRISNFG